MAMTPIAREAALTIARDHTAQVEIDHPDYVMDSEVVGLVDDEWLFVYRIRCLRDIPPGAQENFAGAGGFVILADGAIRDLTAPQFMEAQRRVTLK